MKYLFNILEEKIKNIIENPQFISNMNCGYRAKYLIFINNSLLHQILWISISRFFAFENYKRFPQSAGRVIAGSMYDMYFLNLLILSFFVSKVVS